MSLEEWKTNLIRKIREHSEKILKEFEANILLAREEWPIRFWRRANENEQLRVIASSWMFEKRLAEILFNFDDTRETRLLELKKWLGESDNLLIDALDSDSQDFQQMINLFGSTYTTCELDKAHSEFKTEYEKTLDEKLTEKELRLSKESSRFDSQSISQFMSLNMPRYILSATP